MKTTISNALKAYMDAHHLGRNVTGVTYKVDNNVIEIDSADLDRVIDTEDISIATVPYDPDSVDWEDNVIFGGQEPDWAAWYGEDACVIIVCLRRGWDTRNEESDGRIVYRLYSDTQEIRIVGRGALTDDDIIAEYNADSVHDPELIGSYADEQEAQDALAAIETSHISGSRGWARPSVYYLACEEQTEDGDFAGELWRTWRTDTVYTHTDEEEEG